MSDTCREFRLGEDFFRRLRRRYLVWSVPVMAMLIAVTVLPDILDGTTQMPASMLVAPAVLFAIAVVGTARGYRRLAERYRDLRIVLYPLALKHSLPGQEDVYITADEVSRIVSSPGNGCGVEGMAGQPAIWIPATIAGYDELMQTLARWRPPEIKTAFWRRARWQQLLSMVLLAAMVFVFVVNDRMLVTAVGVPLAAYLAWAVFALRRSPYVNAKQKRGAGTLLIAIALLTLKMVMLWRA